MQFRQVAFSVTVLFCLAGCGTEPRSEIVAMAEAAGSGKLSGVSRDGMKQWLGQHKDVAYQVDEMCKPVRIRATAQWTESTEGRLCSAARELAFFRSGPVKNSGKTYWPGK